MMQRDLERARENLRQEQVVSEQQKQLLESRLKDEVRVCLCFVLSFWNLEEVVENI